MPIALNPAEARVLGALIEKEITTPEYYPLSLHALVAACNQKSNRDPWMQLDEEAVRLALRGLSDKGLAGGARSGEQRVPKFQHQVQEVYNFTRPQAAIFCELLLRGSQTPGELRSRAERMHRFTDLEQVHTTLQQLMEFDPPLVQALARQPGTKEIRYAQCLSEPPEPSGERPSAPIPVLENDRVSRLEREVESLRAELNALRADLAAQARTPGD